jgi:hypothetical protein
MTDTDGTHFCCVCVEHLRKEIDEVRLVNEALRQTIRELTLEFASKQTDPQEDLYKKGLKFGR